MNFMECHRTYNKINCMYFRNSSGNLDIFTFARGEFKYLYDVKWLATEKIDGSCHSYYWDGHELQIHGKTENAQIPKHLLKKMEELVPIEKFKEVFPIKYDEQGNEVPFMVRVYGEGYGMKIQKGGGSYISKDCSFRVFDVNINGYWLDWVDVCDVAKKLGLETVVSYGEMTLREAEKMVINGFKSPIAENKELDAEGLVLRPLVTLFNKKNERVMVKIKTCDYRKIGIKDYYDFEDCFK